MPGISVRTPASVAPLTGKLLLSSPSSSISVPVSQPRIRGCPTALTASRPWRRRPRAVGPPSAAQRPVPAGSVTRSAATARFTGSLASTLSPRPAGSFPGSRSSNRTTCRSASRIIVQRPPASFSCPRRPSPWSRHPRRFRRPGHTRDSTRGSLIPHCFFRKSCWAPMGFEASRSRP